ncbi:hypothetical protein AKJ16_DCAP13091 [Drosera capensis]
MEGSQLCFALSPARRFSPANTVNNLGQPRRRDNRPLLPSRFNVKQMALRQKVRGTLPIVLRSLKKDNRKPPSPQLPSLRRAFSLYDQINLIDNVPDEQLMFQEYDETGFKCFSSKSSSSSSAVAAVASTQDERQQSFMASYFIDSCGLSAQRAVDASRIYANKLRFDTPEKPDSMLAFLRNNGFTGDDIAMLLSLIIVLDLSIQGQPANGFATEGGRNPPILLRSLKKDNRKPRVPQLLSRSRAFSLYGQLNLIDEVPDEQLLFQVYDETGFEVNEVKYDGSVLCVGNLLLLEP